MPVFAANLSTMFTEWDFLDRFAAAADHGFEAVEIQFPYDHRPDSIAASLERSRQKLVLFNAPPGDWEAGERGLAALPERADAFRASLAQAKIYAEHTGAGMVHVMAGIAAGAASRRAYVEALRLAVERLDPLTVTIEPLNPRDVPGYYLNDFRLAAEIVAEVGSPRLKLQYDVYHRQMLHGDVLSSLAELMPIVGHVQIAAAPTRTEPGTGELNDDLVLSRLDTLGYRGFVGCEYRPARGTVAGLGWLKQRRRTQGGDLSLRSTWRERM